MKSFVLVMACILIGLAGWAQKTGDGKPVMDHKLPDVKACMHTAQQNLPLFMDAAQATDVNTIIKDIETYIDSIKNRSYSDVMLNKYFSPLRHFFLTTTNKTSVAAEFLYTGMPYAFCNYNDTALTLYIWAVKDGDSYNLSKTTDKRIAQKALEDCLLPSLAALDEFKDGEIKYVAMSVYYGCKDTREGAPAVAVVPYCLTLVARMSDVQQYAAGLITNKGLLANAEVSIWSEP